MGISAFSRYLFSASREAVAPARRAVTNGGGLVKKSFHTGVKDPVQQGQNLSAGVGVVDRRAKHKTVRFFRFGNHLVDHVIAKDALALPGTAVAADAVPDRASAHLDDLCLHALLIQRLCRFRKGKVCAAVLASAAV